MKEYMTGVFLASAIISLLNHISYRSALDGVRKFAMGLILLSVTASPLLIALDSFANFDPESIIPDIEDMTEGDDELYEKAFREGIASAVAEKFDLRREDIRVLTEGFSPSVWQCEKIRVILSGLSVLSDYHKIENYVNEIGIGECEVKIEIG